MRRVAQPVLRGQPEQKEPQGLVAPKELRESLERKEQKASWVCAELKALLE